MIFTVVGSKYIGWPVSNGLRKEIYCSKCGKVRSFMELQGRKYFHVSFVPVLPISKKMKWLECDYCESVLLNHEQKIKDYEENLVRENEFEKNRKEAWAIIEEEDRMKEYLDVKCPSCKSIGKVKLLEKQLLAEAICQKCGNVYEVRKPN